MLWNSESEIHHQYRRRHYEHQDHLEHIHLEKTPNDEIPPTSPLFPPLGIPCIFFVVFELAESDMRDDPSSPEAYECCDSDLMESHTWGEERYDCDEYKTKTPEYIDDGVISYSQRIKEEEDIWDEESKEDCYHGESV